ncbi:MAG TPA: phenylalanine--tRNA ligase subunit beta [Acidobacteriaceae bacterium]|nr:phenylalanine--tRNA ligase subunit beta [Acidobacteriaceae bacterium]
MKVLSSWLRAYLPGLQVSDRQLADDLTLRGIAVEGVFDLGPSNGSLFEMDITTNRVDAMNHYGIAREAAAIYDIPLLPLDVLLPASKPVKQPFPVRIEAPVLCGRFTARVLRNVTIAPSGGQVAQRFARLEQKTISNAVDATNYVTIAMGHPTHAFDLDKVEGSIVVRLARAGERLKLLDETERTLTGDDLVVADEKKALALAGVMGGWDTMITPGTKNILVEAAWFDPGSVRRSSRRHKLHTDASHRFERGADFAAPPVASAMVSGLILAAGGELHGDLVDVIVPELAVRTVDRPAISLPLEEVARILGRTAEGSTLEAETVERYLSALGCRVQTASAAHYSVTLPSWRLDLEREIDLIEEIARLHGYNRFANTLPSFSGSVVELPTAGKENLVRRKLLAAGYTETVGSTFCSVADAGKFSHQPNVHVPLGNPLSEEVGCLRPSLLPGMLAMLAHNLNREAVDVRLFEAGTVFAGTTDRVQERPSLAVGATGSAIAGHAHFKGRPFTFYDLKGVAEEVLSGFSTRSLYFDAFSAATGLMPVWLHPGRSARLVADGETIGFFGQLAPDEAQRRKLRHEIFLGEFDLERLYRHALREPAAQELSRFPAVVRDFSFVFPESIAWQSIADRIRALNIAELRSLHPVEIFRDEKAAQKTANLDPGHFSLLLRAVFQSQERTLRDEEVQGWWERIATALQQIGGAWRDKVR